ncbi:MAG TPA: M20/M25/M40 family metallo-hydrolase, partial [bacterium]|nr:M20/M25/M40 family metallo-hydrolase [bacterium]
GIYHLDVDGIASHAGADPEEGRSAILELAHQVVDLQGLNNAAAGTTLNVGVIRGGTRANVVAARAEAEIDLRVRTSEEARLAHERILNRPTFVAGTTVHVRGGLNRPPMEESAGAHRLYALAKRIAAEEGFALPAGGTGGGSDGNFTAALGVPTLDGLGAVGDGGHADHEHVRVSTIAPRLAWFARLLAEL